MDIRNAEAVYPLSPVQEAALSESLDSMETGRDCGQWSCTLQGVLHIPALEQAWQDVLSHYSILRTFFVWKRVEKPLQVVHKQLAFPVEQQDWLGVPAPERQERLASMLAAEREKTFALTEAPLIRLTLCRTATDTHHLVCTYHRLVLDELSLHLILKEVFAYYEALCEQRTPSLTSGQSYRNYLAWLKQQDATEAEAFWRHELKGFYAPTPVVVEQFLSGSTRAAEDYDVRQVQLPANTTAALRAWASEHQLSLKTMVQGAWAVLLSRYSGEDDIVFGLTVSIRPSEVQGGDLMVGPLTNTLPVRVRTMSDGPVASWLKELEDRQTERLRYAYIASAQAREWSEVPTHLPLYRSSIILDSQSSSWPPKQIAHVTIGNTKNYGPPSAPLILKAQLGTQCGLQIVYDRGRFDGAAITRMLEQLLTILEHIVEPGQKLSTLPLLSPQALHQLLVEWNDTKTAATHDLCINELFEAQVERTPDIPAVMYGDEQLSYRALNERANQLAHYLRQRGVGPSVRVGLCIERSLEMVTGILGVLKTGGAYVPMDPSYPYERLLYMLTDAQPPVLLSQDHLVEELPSFQGQLICLDTDWEQIARQSTENPRLSLSSDQLAYIIYTSGSTGQPKGVMVPHRGVCNSSDFYARIIDMPPGSRMLQLTSLGFDMSVFDIVPALISGLTLCLATQSPPLGLDLLRVIQEQKIQIMSFPPSVLATIPAAELPELRFIGVAGEAVSAELVERWAPGRRFYNAYGPAEGSIWVSGVFLDGSRSPHIGRPIDNIELYVLDSRLRPVPVGVPGELCIGGIGVTWGYLRQPGVTAEKYVPHPYSGKPGARLYRTRYLPDGTIDFMGRTDSQVKIRGFRIELGEVETVLARHPAVREVAVIAREDAPGDKRLVAYLSRHAEQLLPPAQSPNGEQPPLTVELHNYLKEKLPETMIPSTFVVLDALPLSPNGKVDRLALPAPDLTRPELKESFVAPSNHVEEVLADIWANVLRLERVGVHDNFFQLGGHSLLATQVVTRVREALQVDLSVPHLFEAPTIIALSKMIEQSTENNSPLAQSSIAPVARETHRLKRSVLESAK
jgi:amino acid adenylation domain-containing protein